MSKKINFFLELYNSNGWLIFLLFFLSSHFLYFLDFEFVNTDLVYAQYLEDASQKKYDKYNDFVADFEDDFAELNLEDDEVISTNWDDLLWDSIFIIIDFIFSVPAVVGLFIVGFLFDRKYEQIKYTEVFKIVMLANFVFLLPDVLSLFWFMVVHTDYSMQDLRAFNPMYLISYLNREDLPHWSLSFLNLINLYEVLFVLLVAYGLTAIYPFKFKEMLSKIVVFYLGGLVFWNIIWIYIGTALG